MCGLELAGMEPLKRASLIDGWMQKIDDEFLVPFIRNVYPHSHCFMQDNDPKHTSRQAQGFFAVKGINWWPTPPEAPDANPIENLWHELKVHIYMYVHTNVHKTM